MMVNSALLVKVNITNYWLLMLTNDKFESYIISSYFFVVNESLPADDSDISTYAVFEKRKRNDTQQEEPYKTKFYQVEREISFWASDKALPVQQGNRAPLTDSRNDFWNAK